MNLITALAIVIGALGALATWLFLGPLGGFGLQIWAAFIAWAAFFHGGGNEATLTTNIPAHIWGAIMGTVALVAVGQTAAGVPMIAVIVGATVAIMILAAEVPLLAGIPAAVYGYASAAAYGLLVAGATPMAIGLTNPAVSISASMIIGALFGYASGKIAGALSK